MDKIDKIHIARVPYNIEATAETELKKYLLDIKSNLDPDTADEVIQGYRVTHTRATSLKTHKAR